MMYTIPQTSRENVLKLITRFEKKANQYGQKFSCKVGEPYAREVHVYHQANGVLMNLNETVMVEAFDLEIEADELIHKNGYEVVARIEHLNGGNIVNTFKGDLNPSWTSTPAHCDHCNGNHGQRITFIVRHEDGSEKQVGRTCLKDYCGIDPQMIGRYNELSDLLISDDVDHYDFTGNPISYAYDTMEVLALSTRIYKEYGYVTSREDNSNKSRLKELIGCEHPTDEERTRAKEIADTVLDMDNACAYRLDVIQTLLRTGYCKMSHFGYVAYAPAAYETYLKQHKIEQEREARTQSERESSGYIGEVGERMIVDVSSIQLLTSFENNWGMTYMYKIVDNSGNVMIWYASSRMSDAESVKRLKVTVKKHGERDGIKQTVVTRCCAA